METLRKSLLKGASILGLVISAASSSLATTGALTKDPNILAWRMVARKNFIEGFCVAQNLNSQGIVVQANQQVDQATINALKLAVSACKSGSKTNIALAPATSPLPGSTASPLPVTN